MTPRTLSLKREELQELTSDDLAGLAGGGPTMTCYSCMTYVSCYWSDCNCPTINPACW